MQGITTGTLTSTPNENTPGLRPGGAFVSRDYGPVAPPALAWTVLAARSASGLLAKC